MTITAPIPTIHRHEVSVSHTSHVHRIDGVVEALAVAMLKWSHAREARAAMSSLEHYRRRQLATSARQRELQALRLTQRLGL